jgi:hypothetical protein
LITPERVLKTILGFKVLYRAIPFPELFPISKRKTRMSLKTSKSPKPQSSPSELWNSMTEIVVHSMNSVWNDPKLEVEILYQTHNRNPQLVQFLLKKLMLNLQMMNRLLLLTKNQISDLKQIPPMKWYFVGEKSSKKKTWKNEFLDCQIVFLHNFLFQLQRQSIQ